MKKTINFTKYRFIMIAVSLVLLAGGLAGTLLQDGFNLGIDFRPGLNLQVEFDNRAVVIEQVREALDGFDGVQVQELGSDEVSRFSIRLQNDNGDEDFRNFLSENSAALTAALSASLGGLEVVGEDYVEPRFAADLALNATILVVAAIALILLYLWVRFRIAYAVSSIVALVHDIAFMVLFIGTFQIEVSSATIAAVLTIMGYSLNDTIVIFDRIRENEKLLSESSFVQVINVSITQSLSRTIITSITTLLAVTAIYIFTTGQIQAFALNIGSLNRSSGFWSVPTPRSLSPVPPCWDFPAANAFRKRSRPRTAWRPPRWTAKAPTLPPPRWTVRPSAIRSGLSASARKRSKKQNPRADLRIPRLNKAARFRAAFFYPCLAAAWFIF
jgi:preprotein translocase subunit SecF